MLAETRAQHLLFLGGEPFAELCRWRGKLDPHSLDSETVKTLLNAPSSHPLLSSGADLIWVDEATPALSHQDAVVLLGTLRNFLNTQICVTVRHNSHWKFDELLGLGFKRLHTCMHNDEQVDLFSYAIASYNFTRKWNNAKYWANPERFHMARW